MDWPRPHLLQRFLGLATVLGLALAFLQALGPPSTPKGLAISLEPAPPVTPTSTSDSAPAPAPSDPLANAPPTPLWVKESTKPPAFLPTRFATSTGEVVRLEIDLRSAAPGDRFAVRFFNDPNSVRVLTVESRSSAGDATVLTGRLGMTYNALFTLGEDVIYATIETPKGILEGIGSGERLWIYDPRLLEKKVNPDDVQTRNKK